MNRQHSYLLFTTRLIQDNQQGFIGLELYCKNRGKESRAASIIFWDACGQFAVETHDTDVPLDIMEELIAEAKEKIKTK
jgi:hypothetical protein